jgi:hypothetical protein
MRRKIQFLSIDGTRIRAVMDDFCQFIIGINSHFIFIKHVNEKQTQFNNSQNKSIDYKSENQKNNFVFCKKCMNNLLHELTEPRTEIIFLSDVF